MFGAILTFLVTGMQIYVFWRTASVPLVKRHVPFKVLVSLGVVLWLAFLFGRLLGHGVSGITAGKVELIGMTWMVMLFLTSVSLFTTELITGFGYLMPRWAPTLRGFALVTGLTLTVIAQIQGLRTPEVHNYDVYLQDLPCTMDGKVLVAMSDLHLGSQLNKSWMKERVTQVMEQRPDLVVLLGDLFEGHGAPKGGLLPVLRRLSAPLGVWAVPGNHELHGGGDPSLALIKAAGIQVLLNRWVEVRPGLVLAGIEDLTAVRRAGQKNDYLARALANRPPGATILLSHTPWEYEKAAKDRVGLMLSGHTHGGQIWPFGYFVRLSYPLLEGRYEVSGMTVIVCRGTGTWGPRMRLWHTGEILRVTLHCMPQKSTSKKVDVTQSIGE